MFVAHVSTSRDGVVSARELRERDAGRCAELTSSIVVEHAACVHRRPGATAHAGRCFVPYCHFELKVSRGVDPRISSDWRLFWPQSRAQSLSAAIHILRGTLQHQA